MSNEVDGLLKLVSEAPEGQLCKTITERVKGIIGKPDSEVNKEIKSVICDCVNGGLASRFAMGTLNIIYDMTKGKHE